MLRPSFFLSFLLGKRGHGRSDRFPGTVRIISRIFARYVRCIRTEILLIDNTRSIDEEGHNSCRSVIRGPGDQGESLGHPAILIDIVPFTLGGVGSLTGEDPEVVSVKRSVPDGISLGDRFGHDIANRAFLLTGLARPV